MSNLLKEAYVYTCTTYSFVKTISELPCFCCCMVSYLQQIAKLLTQPYSTSALLQVHIIYYLIMSGQPLIRHAGPEMLGIDTKLICISIA